MPYGQSNFMLICTFIGYLGFRDVTSQAIRELSRNLLHLLLS